jgi:hypothetical protein
MSLGERLNVFEHVSASLLWVACITALIDVLTAAWFLVRWNRQASRKRRLNRLRNEPLLTDDTRAAIADLEEETTDYARSVRQSKLQFTLFLVAQWAALVVVATDPTQRWKVVTAMLPLLLVLYHAGHLWLETPNTRGLEEKGTASNLRVRHRIMQHYGWETLFARYVIPGILIVVVGLVTLTLTDPDTRPKFPPIGPAFNYGVIGAYFYVFLELGKRSVRHDITPVSIVWCLITLIIGPALAAVIPTVLSGKAQLQEAGGLWNESAVWIFAGYSPRLVFRTLAAGVTKSLRADTSSLQEQRQISLGRIQGIGAEEAERLGEEGVRDVHAMACVDPVRLMRDTRFDNWRIISWLDQAILLSVVPEELWRALVKRGYQGATDTFDLVLKVTLRMPVREPLAPKSADTILEEVADEAGVDADVVRAVLMRVWEDSRVWDVQSLLHAVVDGDRPRDPQDPDGGPKGGGPAGAPEDPAPAAPAGAAPAAPPRPAGAAPASAAPAPAPAAGHVTAMYAAAPRSPFSSIVQVPLPTHPPKPAEPPAGPEDDDPTSEKDRT